MDQSTAIDWLIRLTGVGVVFVVVFYFYGRQYLDWLSGPRFSESDMKAQSAKHLEQMNKNVAERKRRPKAHLKG